MCKMVTYAITDGPPRFPSPTVTASTKCETHDWVISGPTPADGLCPFGRIEAAIEQGIDRIEAAVREKAK